VLTVDRLSVPLRDVRLKALTALTNSLQFVGENFEQTVRRSLWSLLFITNTALRAPHTHIYAFMGPRTCATTMRFLTAALSCSCECSRPLGSMHAQADRNYLMQVVCQATVPGNSDPVKTAALQCLGRIASVYYKHMQLYMEQALFGVRAAHAVFAPPQTETRAEGGKGGGGGGPRGVRTPQITVQAMDDANEDVRKQAIEFWSTVCDEERMLAEEVCGDPTLLVATRTGLLCARCTGTDINGGGVVGGGGGGTAHRAAPMRCSTLPMAPWQLWSRSCCRCCTSRSVAHCQRPVATPRAHVCLLRGVV
jgi:hypothetical protein